jgi:surface polysaccharide O-acyltransferase-like enzyme
MYFVSDCRRYYSTHSAGGCQRGKPGIGDCTLGIWELSLFETPAPSVASVAREAAPSRLVLVDVARVFAILFMVQGHTLDVVLAPEYRQGALFAVWLFLRGLTAPLFFILSGVSFTVATMRRNGDFGRPSRKTLRRFGRFIFFILLGYVMHLPAGSLDEFRYVDAAGWQSWFQADVLQCIGFALISLQVMVLLARAPERLARYSSMAAGAVLLATPVVWAVDWTTLVPMPVAAYFTSHTGSYFPLFPWIGYVFFGAALGCRLRRWSEYPHKPAVMFAVSGLVLGLSGALLIEPFNFLYGDLDFWRTSPALFLIRAGCVCLLLALFSYGTARLRVPEAACRSLAQESLFVYFLHVCLVYGSLWNPGLRQLVGASLTPLPTLAVILTLLISMMLLAWGWNWLKQVEPRRSYMLCAAVVLLIAIYRPWMP